MFITNWPLVVSTCDARPGCPVFYPRPGQVNACFWSTGVCVMLHGMPDTENYTDKRKPDGEPILLILDRYSLF